LTTKKQDPTSILIKSYFENNDFSDQTSSHWRKYGNLQKIQKTNGTYHLRGIGFGNNEVSKNIFLRIIYLLKNIPLQISLWKLIKNCRKNIIYNMKYVAKNSSRLFDYDCARNVLTVDLIYEKLPFLEEKTFCIIGDGYGSLGCLLKKNFPKSQIIYINLGRTLLFDYHYSKKVFPDLDHYLIRDNNQSFSKDFNYVEAELYKNINIKADIFINNHSMQEMDYEVIKSYFFMIRNQAKDTWFYCCNRISKKLPDGKTINFFEYPWSKKDFLIVNGLCPWAQRFPINIPPFYRNFDGPHQHRLIKVALEK